MSKVIDLDAARKEKEHERKEAKLEKLKNSFTKARRSAVSNKSSTEQLKNLFRKSSKKKAATKSLTKASNKSPKKKK